LRQKYGQHFLSDHAIARRIVEAAAVESNDTVLEIGPGKGVLTDMLAARPGRLIAVEIDAPLGEKLRSRFADVSKVEIITANFLDLDLATITTPVKIVSNLPYYISTAIIERFLPWQGWSNAVVMVQKEVGLRICAHDNASDYGYYSLLCQYYAAAKPLFGVPPTSFSPPPDVDSLVIHLTNKKSGAPPAGIFDLIKQAFAHRRKNVLNAFTISTTRDKESFKLLLEKAGIAISARPQNLTWKDYATLQELLTTG
jgi:16S rRNA (adenine1518-N6/adenine1519-N6)-dimethyltransferase